MFIKKQQPKNIKPLTMTVSAERDHFHSTWLCCHVFTKVHFHNVLKKMIISKATCKSALYSTLVGSTQSAQLEACRKENRQAARHEMEIDEGVHKAVGQLHSAASSIEPPTCQSALLTYNL